MKALLSFSLCLALLGCASTSNQRNLASVDMDLAAIRPVPTVNELFLYGKFMADPPHLGILQEKHKGEELDLSVRRPVVNLHGTVFETKYGKPGYQLYANFYHDKTFYIVNVPNNGVENYHFQLSYFHYGVGIAEKYVKAAHSLLRFEMARPIEIVAKVPSLSEWHALSKLSQSEILSRLPDPIEGKTVKNVAISAEAQWTKNDPKKQYDIARGAVSAFIQIIRFVSIEERFDEFYTAGNPVEQFLMEGPAADGNKVFAGALAASQSDGIDHIYDTRRFNCTTRVFDIIEETLKVKDRRLGFLRKHLSRGMPALAPTKVAQFNGKDLVAIPMYSDASLAEESFNSYKRVVLSKRRMLCPKNMKYYDQNCPNLKAAVATLRRAGKVK